MQQANALELSKANAERCAYRSSTGPCGVPGETQGGRPRGGRRRPWSQPRYESSNAAIGRCAEDPSHPSQGDALEDFPKHPKLQERLPEAPRTSRSTSEPKSTRANPVVTTRAPEIGPNRSKRTSGTPENLPGKLPARSLYNTAASTRKRRPQSTNQTVSEIGQGCRDRPRQNPLQRSAQRRRDEDVLRLARPRPISDYFCSFGKVPNGS